MKNMSPHETKINVTRKSLLEFKKLKMRFMK